MKKFKFIFLFVIVPLLLLSLTACEGTITFYRNINITGEVYDHESWNSIPNAYVVLTTENNEKYYRLTDSNGIFRVDDIRGNQRITIRVTKDDYYSKARSYPLGNSNESLSISLHKNTYYGSVSGYVEIDSSGTSSLSREYNPHEDVKVYAVRDLGEGELQQLSSEAVPGPDGYYYIPDVEAGYNIKIIGWIDHDHNNDINNGDFYGKSSAFSLNSGAHENNINIILKEVTDSTVQSIKSVNALINTVPQ